MRGAAVRRLRDGRRPCSPASSAAAPAPAALCQARRRRAATRRGWKTSPAGTPPGALPARASTRQRRGSVARAALRDRGRSNAHRQRVGDDGDLVSRCCHGGGSGHGIKRELHVEGEAEGRVSGERAAHASGAAKDRGRGRQQWQRWRHCNDRWSSCSGRGSQARVRRRRHGRSSCQCLARIGHGRRRRLRPSLCLRQTLRQLA